MRCSRPRGQRRRQGVSVRALLHSQRRSETTCSRRSSASMLEQPSSPDGPRGRRTAVSVAVLTAEMEASGAESTKLAVIAASHSSVDPPGRR